MMSASPPAVSPRPAAAMAPVVRSRTQPSYGDHFFWWFIVFVLVYGFADSLLCVRVCEYLNRSAGAGFVLYYLLWSLVFYAAFMIVVYLPLLSFMPRLAKSAPSNPIVRILGLSSPSIPAGRPSVASPAQSAGMSMSPTSPATSPTRIPLMNTSASLRSPFSSSSTASAVSPQSWSPLTGLPESLNSSRQSMQSPNTSVAGGTYQSPGMSPIGSPSMPTQTVGSPMLPPRAPNEPELRRLEPHDFPARKQKDIMRSLGDEEDLRARAQRSFQDIGISRDVHRWTDNARKGVLLLLFNDIIDVCYFVRDYEQRNRISTGDQWIDRLPDGRRRQLRQMASQFHVRTAETIYAKKRLWVEGFLWMPMITGRVRASGQSDRSFLRNQQHSNDFQKYYEPMYVFERLEALNRDPSDFRYNSGGSWNGMAHNAGLPTDADLVLHMILRFWSMVVKMMDVPEYMEKHHYRFRTDSQQSSELFYFHKRTLNPPHFNFVVLTGGTREIACEPGDNNVFQVFAIFLHYIVHRNLDETLFRKFFDDNFPALADIVRYL